jgi:tetratricopeptide (TPR) repeat protein
MASRIRKSALKSRHQFTAIFSGALLVMSAPGMAQEGNPNAQGPGEAPVTYQRVLQNPDDLELNLRYARQQMAAGDLTSAASTLERILIKAPSSDRVRLLYGIVLYRLGNFGEADQELQAVNRGALPPGERATLDEFRTKIARKQRRVVGSVGVTAGLHYDTNRNAFPTGGDVQVNLGGRPTTFSVGGSENDDVGQLLMLDGRLDVATDLQRLPGFTFEAAGLIDNQVEADDLDVKSGMLRVETRYLADIVEIVPQATYRQITLGGEQYIRNPEARLRFRRGILGYKDYDEVDRDRFAEEQDGRYLTFAAGIDYTPVNQLALGVRYSYTDKNADQDFEAYGAHSLEATANWVVTSGVIVSGDGRITRRDYDAPDTFVSPSEEREDAIYRFGGGVAVTAQRISKTLNADLPKAVVDNLVFHLSAHYRETQSNFPNFEHDNVRTQFTITKRFPF